MQHAALRISSTTAEVVEGAYRDLAVLKKRHREILHAVSRTRETMDETKSLLARIDGVLRAYRSLNY